MLNNYQLWKLLVNVKGTKTNITSAHLKKVISKTLTLLDKYLAAICIIIKLNPDIIIKIIGIDAVEKLLNYSTKLYIQIWYI